MTIGVDLSVDPVEAFLSQGAYGDYVEPEDAEPHDRTGVVIAAGVITSAALVVQALRVTAPPATAGAAQELLADVWRTVAPTWLRLVLPGVVHAFELGSTAQLTHDELEHLAVAYAEALGDYVHETSAEAVLAGFQAQLNSGWDRELAWRRATLGYGLDQRQMRQYIVPLLTRPTSFVAEEIPTASRRLVSALLARRAQRIGDGEGYHATQLGKQLVWQYLVAQGLLRQDAQKRWITKDDELVCPTCGPLHKVAVPVADTFEVGGLHLLAPGVHPNCRCTVELTYPEIVEKAWDEAKVKRDREGQFARVDTRTKVKDPQLSQDALEVAALLARGVAQDQGLATIDGGLAAVDSGLALIDDGLASSDDGLATADEGLGLDLAPEDTGFGAALRARSKTRRVTQIFWLPKPDGTVEETISEENVTIDDAPSWRVHQGTATMNAADYFAAVRQLMYSSGGGKRFVVPDETHELLNPRKGTVIDFDATGEGGVAELGPEAGTQWIPPSMKVAPNTDVSDVDHISSFVSWMQAKSEIGSRTGQQTRSYQDEVSYSNVDEFTYGDEQELVDRLESTDLDALAVLARRKGGVLPANWYDFDDVEKAAYVASMYYAEQRANRSSDRWNYDPGPWETVIDEAARTYALQYSADGYQAADLMDSTQEDIPPDMFVFDGWYGQAPGLVEGKYLVTDIEIKPLTILQQTELAEELDARGGGPGFREIRVFHLRPLEPAWFPQTPDELARGLPPVDYEA